VSDLQLTEQQADALEDVDGWLANGAPGGVFRLGGYAGTGKTTIARMLTSRPVAFGAYTGKAVQVLRSKGIAAETLHRLMYLPKGDGGTPEVRALIDRIRNTINDRERDDLAYRLRKAAGGRSFSFNPDGMLAELKANNGVLVVDEASMVDAAMAADLTSSEVPVIALGDPMQLPPIGNGRGVLFDPEKMDVMLTDVKRQDGPLAEAMLFVRENKRVPAELYDTPLARLEADQIITHTNAKRWETIKKTRAQLGLKPGVPTPLGDRIIVTQNNTDKDVFNGQQFVVLDVIEGRQTCAIHAVDSVTGEERELNVWIEGFHDLAGESALNQTPYNEQKQAVCATFAHAITCHKAQGSEWDKVIVVEEPGIFNKSKWLYTAVTRARVAVKVVKPKRVSKK